MQNVTCIIQNWIITELMVLIVVTKYGRSSEYKGCLTHFSAPSSKNKKKQPEKVSHIFLTDGWPSLKKNFSQTLGWMLTKLKKNSYTQDNCWLGVK